MALTAEAPTALPVRFTLPAHARRRALAMEVAEWEVWDVLTNPEVAYAQPRYGEGRFMLQRERLAVPIAIDGRCAVVLTVLWRAVDTWVR